MRPRRPLPDRLLIVTDRHQSLRPLAAAAEAAFASGARWIWLRDRDLPVRERRALAHDLAACAARWGGVLTVGADVALAAEVGAGVQLTARQDLAAARRSLGAEAWIGVSTHHLDELRRATEAEADYATLSPIFPSSSKPGYGPALGLDALREAAKLGLPILALGGVSVASAHACRDAGAGGVAVMGPVMRDIETVATLRSVLSCHRTRQPVGR